MYKITRKSLKFWSLLLILLFICVNHERLTVNAAEKTLNSAENKSLSNINMNDEFDDKSLLIVIKPSESQYYGISSALEEKLNSIEEVQSYEDLTELSVESLANNGIDSKYYDKIEKHLISIEFKQILKINLNTTSKLEVVEVIKIIETFEEVLSASPNYIYNSNEVTVDDTNFNNQWALFGTHGIDVTKAWDFTTGSNDIRVGVIDSGIANHLDLNSNVVTGKDFYNNNSITTDDIGGHGTSVAGIIGAIANNGRGIAGINHNVSLVPLQTAYDTSANGHHYTEDLVEAIRYARDLWDDTENRISIINYSISNFGYNTSVLAAVEMFQGLFVWGAGNKGENLDQISGIEEFSLDNLISVGAHDQNGQRSIWNTVESSSYGHIVNIYAPSVCYTTHSTTNNSYRDFGGTSAAAPHVTGVAALLLSLNPDLTAMDLKNIILNSAENINITIPNGTTQSVKKLNAFNAVKYALDNYALNSYNLTSDGISIEKTIQPSSSYFYEKNMFIKLNVSNSCEYDFTIVGNYSVDVKLYDGDLNEITINKTVMEINRRITFSNTLTSGEYYVSIYSSYSEPQLVDLIIESDHTHSYTIYRIYNATHHKAICSCGASILQFHVVSIDDKTKCVVCNGFVSSSGIGTLSINQICYIGENGSYILPNGIIVLVEADLKAFMKGELDVYNRC